MSIDVEAHQAAVIRAAWQMHDAARDAFEDAVEKGFDMDNAAFLGHVAVRALELVGTTAAQVQDPEAVPARGDEPGDDPDTERAQ